MYLSVCVYIALVDKSPFKGIVGDRQINTYTHLAIHIYIYTYMSEGV